MSILRRLFGGHAPAPEDAAPDDPAGLEEAERGHELELARSEQERLDELQQRQLRYERYAWEPPAQGGDRRADDETEAE